MKDIDEFFNELSSDDIGVGGQHQQKPPPSGDGSYARQNVDETALYRPIAK